ncbi:MAG: hypothetical protein H0U76_23505 [Ktedonobacteraceae bacterium]|nr:hypothetical protein [Ktedonobacteraceae bacterium]
MAEFICQQAEAAGSVPQGHLRVRRGSKQCAMMIKWSGNKVVVLIINGYKGISFLMRII